MAAGRPTRQSSELYGGASKLAVDGKREGTYSGGTCTHTGKKLPEWWQVDLGSSIDIGKVTIWHRTDKGTEKRLTGAKIVVSDSSNFTTGKTCSVLGDQSSLYTTGRASQSRFRSIRGRMLPVHA